MSSGRKITSFSVQAGSQDLGNDIQSVPKGKTSSVTNTMTKDELKRMCEAGATSAKRRRTTNARVVPTSDAIQHGSTKVNDALREAFFLICTSKGIDVSLTKHFGDDFIEMDEAITAIFQNMSARLPHVIAVNDVVKEVD